MLILGGMPLFRNTGLKKKAVSICSHPPEHDQRRKVMNDEKASGWQSATMDTLNRQYVYLVISFHVHVSDSLKNFSGNLSCARSGCSYSNPSCASFIECHLIRSTFTIPLIFIACHGQVIHGTDIRAAQVLQGSWTARI